MFLLRAADNLIGEWRNDRAKELVLESLKQSLRLTGASCGNELRSREREGERERGAVRSFEHKWAKGKHGRRSGATALSRDFCSKKKKKEEKRKIGLFHELC